MTLEELDIIVQARIEPALKELKKLMPQIKQQVTQSVEVVQKSMEKVDMKKVNNKIQQGIQLIKRKIDNFKKSTKNNEIAIKVNNKDAEKQISQLEKEIDSLQKKINARQMKLDIINPQLDNIVSNTKKEVIPEGVPKNSPVMDNVVNNTLSSNKEFTTLNNQAQKLYTEIEMYNNQLNEAKNKMSQLKSETQQTGASQNKMTNFFSAFNGKLSSVKNSLGNISNIFDKLPNITQKITTNIKNMGTGLKTGLKHVLKYAGALLSLRGIYSVLSNSASSWLSSQNAGAQQLSANINYLKYAMGSVFAPVIQTVVNLVYQLMKAIQSVVYAFSGINIFAKATAKSMNSTANSAKKAKKEVQGLADIDEIHNIQKDEDSNSDSGSGTVAPSMDLSNIDKQMSPFAQKLYDFFKPLKESWDKYGSGLILQIKTTVSQVTGLISSVWGSFEKIITNGTAYKTLELILAIIGDITEAFANAWNYNGNGDAIIQNLANALNNLLTAIDNIIKDPKFQEWLNNCSDKFRKISEKIAEIDWQPLIDALFDIGSTLGTIALDILSGLVSIFSWLIEHPEVAEILGAIAIAVGLVVAAIKIWNAVQAIWNIISSPMTLTIMLIVGAILALIAIISAVVIVIKNWSKIWEVLKTTITKIVTTIKDKVKKAFDAIKNGISNAMNKIKTTIKNIWNGIWSTIKGIINKILGGVEKFINGAIKGINKLLSGISKVASAVGSVLGFGPVSLQISTISLPRLAKGNVAYGETLGIFGEYSGAKNNPEITTPQNIMAETFEKVLNKHSNNGETINFTNELKLNSKTLAREIIQDLNNEAKRLGYKPILQRG